MKEQNKNKNRSGTSVGKRLCLSCRQSFQSEGWHHRICDSCKGQKSWLGGNPLYDCQLPVKAANDNVGS